MAYRATNRFYVLGLVIILVAVGCYQPAPDAIQSTPQSMLVPSDTPTITASPTMEISPSPTVELTEEVVSETPTLTETAVLDQPIANMGTQVAQADDPIIPEETQAVQPVAPDADPFQLTATAFVALITETVEIQMTQTAEALGIGMSPTPAATLTPDPALGQPTSAPVPIGADCIHEVRAGETLFRLSLLYGVLVRDIANRSGVTNINQISIGQKLTIPGCGTTGAVPPPTSIPLPSSTPFGAVDSSLTGQAAASVGPPVPSGTMYTVEQGETLFEIALRFGVSVNDIAALNGIANINRILLGQELVIPAAR